MAKSSHLIISGMTESGKSFFAHELCGRMFQKRSCLVLDMMSGDGSEWACDYWTDDPVEFQRVAMYNEQCFLFIDEGGESLNKWAKETEWFGTQSRQWGHRLVFVTQRLAQMNATIRGQCGAIVTFNVHDIDAKKAAETFNDPDLKLASVLPEYEFLLKRRFKPCVRGKLMV